MTKHKIDLDEIFKRADALVVDHQARLDMMEEMDRLYRLDTAVLEETKGPGWIKDLRDSTPHDAIETCVEVLSVHEPQIVVDVPTERLDRASTTSGGLLPAAGALGPTGAMTQLPELNPNELANTMENVARTVIRDSNARSKFPLLQDLIRSSFLFGQGVIKVGDLREHPDYERRQRQFGRSPFSLRSVSPMEVLDEWDSLGLAVVLHRYKRRLADLIRTYPDITDWSPISPDENGHVIFCEWWTPEITCKWIERTVRLDDYNSDKANQNQLNQMTIVEPQENTLGFIPFVIKGSHGSALWSGYDRQIYPLLYSGWKSRLFFRANLFLSVVSSLAFAMANPQWTYASASGDKKFEIDFNAPHVWPIQVGEDVKPMQVGLTRDLYDVLQLVMQKVDGATISRVLAGQGPGGVTAASAINMLVQGGKLKVFPTQMAVGEMLADMVQMVFDYIRVTEEDGQELELYVNQGMQKITAAMLPKVFDTHVKLIADLPQDKMANVQMALQAWKQQLISQSTAWDWAGIEDKVKEQTRMDEQLAQQMAMQQPQMPQGPEGLGAPGGPAQGGPMQGPPGPGGPPPGGPGGPPPMDPQMLAMLMQQGQGLPQQQTPEGGMAIPAFQGPNGFSPDVLPQNVPQGMPVEMMPQPPGLDPQALMAAMMNMNSRESDQH